MCRDNVKSIDDQDADGLLMMVVVMVVMVVMVMVMVSVLVDYVKIFGMRKNFEYTYVAYKVKMVCYAVLTSVYSGYCVLE